MLVPVCDFIFAHSACSLAKDKCSCRYASPLHKGARQWRNPRLAAVAQQRAGSEIDRGRQWQSSHLERSLSLRRRVSESPGLSALHLEQTTRHMRSGRQSLAKHNGMDLSRRTGAAEVDVLDGSREARAAAFWAWRRRGLHKW